MQMCSDVHREVCLIALLRCVHKHQCCPVEKKVLIFILNIYKLVESSLKPHKNSLFQPFYNEMNSILKSYVEQFHQSLRFTAKQHQRHASRSYEQRTQMCLVPPTSTTTLSLVTKSPHRSSCTASLHIFQATVHL